MDFSVPALPVAPRPLGWMRTTGAVVLGFLVATVATILAALPLDALHLLPLNTDLARGQGWPWTIHGPGSLIADAGPLVGLSLVLAACTAWYLATPDNPAVPRWPIALTSVVVGWLPLVGPRGLLGASTGFAFAVTIVVARRVSTMERGRRWFSRRTRIVMALGAAAGLAALTLGFGALNPLTIRASGSLNADRTLVHGIPARRISLQLGNRGPFTAQVLGATLAGETAGVHLLRVDVDKPHARAHTMDELFTPIRGLALHPGREQPAFLVVSRAGCPGGPVAVGGATPLSHAVLATVSAVDVRLRVAGVERTQRVWIPGGLRLGCRTR
jgi:hypothetical protein